MAEAVEVRFPRSGSDYVPLPRGTQGNRVTGHAVQTINATPEQVYALFSRPETLHIWQEGVLSVTQTGENKLHYVMQDPATGKQTEFNSEVVEAVPGKRHKAVILDGPFAGTSETLELTEDPASRGTRAVYIGDYQMPGGALTSAVAAALSRGPEQMLIENLRHLKELLEAGQIPNVEGQPAGPRGVMGKWKQFLMGENMPTPPGTSERGSVDGTGEQTVANPWVVGSVAIAAAAGAWWGMRKLIED